MRSNLQHRTWIGKQAGLVCVAIFLLAGFCFSQPVISLSPSGGPPTSSLRVSGSGFAPFAKIDIYFGTQDEAVAVANGSGSFSQIAIPAPASALPGTHWVSAVERSGHTVAQATFLVHTDWRQFHRHDMKRWNRFENVLNVKNVGSLQSKWNYPIGGEVWSSPAVVNGVVYVASLNDSVYAVKASTGTLLWSYATGGSVYWSSPAVANGVVYVGSADGNLYALEAGTGALVWSYAIGGEVTTSPALADGVVYVGQEFGNVFALKASTGALLWSSPVSGQVESSPAVANGVVYVGTDEDYFYALKASTGAVLWNYYTGYAGQVQSSPAVANGVVYFGSENGNSYALNANTGALLWSYATGSVYSGPAVAKGVVYVYAEDGTVYALNASTGALLWSYLTSAPSGALESPAVANGVVYVVSHNSTVYALNASTGTLLWSNAAYIEGPPTVVNGVVYTGGDGGVHAFGLKKGREQADAASKRPGLKMLHPDFNLKVSQPSTAPADAD